MPIRSFVWSAALLLIAGLSATAQQAGDPVPGRRLADAACASCHGARNAKQPAADLAAIAAMPSTTAQSLGVFLKSSHAKMPNFILSNEERDDVIAYILSLRR